MFLAVLRLKGHAAAAHVDLNGALCPLDQQVMLLPPERGAVLQKRVPVLGILHGNKQHIVLIPVGVLLMGHIAPCHGHLLRTAAHQKLDAVQLVDVMVQMAP